MRKVLLMSGLVFLLVSCANDSNNATTESSVSDTTAAPNTESYGGAGTGGVGAGYGPGGRAGVDTNLPSGAVADTSLR
jgi:hypothetical protein